MNSKVARRVYDIVYPLFFYYILYYGALVVFGHFFADSFGSLFCLLLAAMLCIPLQVYYFRKAVIIRRTEKMKGRELLEAVLWIVGIVALGTVINIVVAHLPLEDMSGGFRQSSAMLRDGSLVIRIVTNGVVVPILEELLYRGVICGQMEAWGSVGSLLEVKPKTPSLKVQVLAVVVSAVLFGALHFNMVQFLYAVIMGVVLGVAYIRTHRLWVVIVAHGLTNLVVILASVLIS